MKSSGRLAAEIDYKIEDLWRRIDALIREADEKTAWMKKIRATCGDKGVPLMTSDTPANCWQRICEHYRSIADLHDIKHKYEAEKRWRCESRKPRKALRQ
jgi:hypothetical protein